eukprot:7137660-Karenia_brevis.AAC.1
MGKAAHYQARNLGIDCTCGKKLLDNSRRYGPSVRQRRFSSLRKRVKRAEIVLKQKKRVAKIWLAGLMPSMKYGCNSWAVNRNILRWTRAKASTLTIGGGKHGHQATTFALSPEMDPARDFFAAPIIRYAREVWDASDAETCKQKTLRMGFLHKHMHAILGKWKQGDKAIRGPLSSVLKSLEQLGWRMADPFALIDDEGHRLELTVGSPAYLQDSIHKAIERNHQQELIWKVVSKDRLSDQDYMAIRKGGLAVAWTKLAVHSKKASYDTRRCVAQMATGKYTLAKTLQDFGIEVASTCPMCGQARDTVHHRVFHCPMLEEARGKAFDKQILEQALAMDPKSMLLNLGVCTSQYANLQLLPTADAAWYYPGGVTKPEADDTFKLADGPVYCDGSCQLPSHPFLAHAGWAGVQIGLDGCLIRALCGAVPGFVSQSAVNAEHIAVLFVAANIDDEVALPLKVDCAAV